MDIFEIVSLNSENIIVEYLIEIITPSANKNFTYDKKSLINAIFKLISTFGIQKLSSEENPIPVENNVSMKLYSINGFLKKSILRTSTGPSFNSIPRIDNNQKGNQKISQSERFKVIVLLAISQIVDYPESKGEKVHLINPKWLDKYKFQEIKSLVESKSNEVNYLWNKKYDLNSVSSIINRLDRTKIQLFCTQMNLNEPNSSIASSDEMALADKYIYLYKSFVLVNGSIFKLFQKYFGIPSSEAFSYIHSKTKGDFIIFKDYKSYHPQNPNQLQNLILAGIIDKSIKHI